MEQVLSFAAVTIAHMCNTRESAQSFLNAVAYTDGLKDYWKVLDYLDSLLLPPDQLKQVNRSLFLTKHIDIVCEISC